MSDEVYFKQLSIHHLKEYDRIDAVAGWGDATRHCPCMWQKSIMPRVSPGALTKTLEVRIGTMDGERLRRLHERICVLDDERRRLRV
jgi:hypothetical protein